MPRARRRRQMGFVTAPLTELERTDRLVLMCFVVLLAHRLPTKPFGYRGDPAGGECIHGRTDGRRTNGRTDGGRLGARRFQGTRGITARTGISRADVVPTAPTESYLHGSGALSRISLRRRSLYARCPAGVGRRGKKDRRSYPRDIIRDRESAAAPAVVARTRRARYYTRFSPSDSPLFLVPLAILSRGNKEARREKGRWPTQRTRFHTSFPRAGTI